LIVTVASIVVVLSTPLWVKWLFFNEYRPNGMSILFVPLLVALAAAVLVRFERSSQYSRRLFIAGLFLKLLFAALYVLATFELYGGSADSAVYFDGAAAGLASTKAQIYGTEFGTPFAFRATELAIELFGTSFGTISVAFAVLAFLGTWLSYRAALVARLHFDVGVFLPLLVLTPSCLFWSATIGKDAMVVFGIGAFCYGFATMVTGGRSLGGPLAAGCGILLVLLIRPHIAAMLTVSSGFSWLRGRAKGPFWQAIGIAFVGVSLFYTLAVAQRFLRLEDFSLSATSEVLTDRMSKSNYGGSAIGMASLPRRFALGPAVLFRPFPWESSSPMALASSAEGMMLLVLIWVRRRNLGLALRRARSHPYVLFLWIFVFEFLVAFSSISNWGTIARQRVMVYPMVFLLVSMSTARMMSSSGHRVRSVGKFGKEVSS
jgi:hypothetical protein